MIHTKTSLDQWHQKKQELSQKNSEKIFFEREIWLVALGQNLGVEMNGKKNNFARPVLIFKKYNRKQCLILPLTTKGNESSFYFNLKDISFLKSKSYISLSQIRVIDQKRFIRKLGKLSVGQFLDIKKSAQAMLEPRSPRWL